jgi:hypothetical protein
MKILTADGKEIELDQYGRRKRDLACESAEKPTAAKHRRIEVVDRRDDGTLRKTSKADLAHQLEQDVSIIQLVTLA